MGNISLSGKKLPIFFYFTIRPHREEATGDWMWLSCNVLHPEEHCE